MSSKQCFRCGELKPIDQFYAHPMMKDGHLGKCKECTKLDALKHRLANAESVRQYDRNRSSLSHRKELRQTSTKEWRLRFPNRKRAQAILNNAVLSGRIVPMPCFVCGEKAEAHHPDYDAPLAVAWLCTKHHRQAHAIVSHLDSDDRLTIRLSNTF